MVALFIWDTLYLHELYTDLLGKTFEGNVIEINAIFTAHCLNEK